MMRLRNVLSSQAGGICCFEEAGGLKLVCDMPSEPKISRWQKRSIDSPAILSSATPKTMNPMSLYSSWVPGEYFNGILKAVSSKDSFVDAFRKSFSYAGNPELCA